ncbi:MAG: hypothetical protein V3V33_01805 [Candidatus Lokiarchaeia archaeon]
MLIIAILIVTGGAIVIIGGLIGNKFFGILGGVVMLAGAILLTIAIFSKSGIFDDIAQTLLVDNFFWGSEPIVDWGVWIGFFLAIGGGVWG